jgi:hypothetical protein
LLFQLTHRLFTATGTNVAAGYWSGIESNCSVICASLPTLRPLFSHFFPRLVGTSPKDVSTVQSGGNPPVTGVATQVGWNGQSHSLVRLSNEVKGNVRYIQDIETGQIKEVIIMDQESEQACNRSDGASDRKLVMPGSAF